MIVRHFLGWVRTAPAGERAEATRALARAWLFSDMSSDDFAATEGALLHAARRSVAAGARGDGRSLRPHRRRAAGDRSRALDRPGFGRAADPRTFAAADRRRSGRHRRHRHVRDPVRGRPAARAADAGLRGNRRGRLGRSLPCADRQSGRPAGADLARPHRRALRPHRRDPRELLESHELPAATRLALVGKALRHADRTSSPRATGSAPSARRSPPAKPASARW